MEITTERTAMAQEGLPSSYNVTPFTPTHFLRHEILSFTDILLGNVEEWSKAITPLPPPPPPIVFSDSNRFIKGRLPHRTLAISASLSTLFDESMPILSNVSDSGDVLADNAVVKTQTTIHEALHGNDDTASAASTRSNPSTHTDNVRRFDAAMQVLPSNGMVDVTVYSTDNSLEDRAACTQDGFLQVANDTADVAICDTCKLLPDDTQHTHGSDNTMLQNLVEDNEKVQTLDKDGVSDCFDGSLSTSNVLEGSLFVTDKFLLGLHMKDDGGGKISTKSPVDGVARHSSCLEYESTDPPPNLRCGDADAVAKLPLPSLLTSPDDYNLTGLLVRASGLSPTKCHNDNYFTTSTASSSKCPNENSKGDASMVSEIFLPPFTKIRDGNKSVGDADVVTELPLTSVMKSLENITQATEGLSQLSLPTPQKSYNFNSSRGNTEGEAELPLKPSSQSHDVNGLQRRVMEDCIVSQQDEQVQALEEGELSERLSVDECFEMSEDVTIHGECESHLLNDHLAESKVFESSTDDEMNQPISLFISRYLSRSSGKRLKRKMPPLDMDSNIKTKVKTGHKRKVEEQEQVRKEVLSTDIAAKVQLKRAKGGQKSSSKMARDLYNNVGGLFGVVSKVSAASKTSMGEAKDYGENSFVELVAARARRDQEGSMILHPSVSQTEVVKAKSKRSCTAEKKKKKKQLQKRRKAYEKRLGKIIVKPRLVKPKEKKPCHYYDKGRCEKGLSCPFSHDFTPITKSEACKYFINHCCLKGDDCPYSHALSTFPCKHFHIRGRCMDADSCRFSHEPISEEAKQKLLAKIEQERQAREGNKATDWGSYERIHSKHSVLPSDLEPFPLGCKHGNRTPLKFIKHSVLPSDLELFPLGCKHGNRTPLKFTDAAASKILCLDRTGTGSRSNNISEIPMLVEAKKAASMFVGGETVVNAANLGVNKSMLHNSLLDPTGFLADKSSATHTTKSVTSETGLTKGFSRDSTTTQERKTKVDLFLQEQLNTSHLMPKSKLGVGSERFGGCFALLNQPRAMSMRQTSLLKKPNIRGPSDQNANGVMGSLHSSVDHSHLAPTFKPKVCAGEEPKSNFSVDQGTVFSNEELLGIDSSVPNPSVLGPSLLDLVSAPQRAMFPKGTTASTSGLLSPTVNTTSKRSAASAFLDRFLKA